MGRIDLLHHLVRPLPLVGAGRGGDEHRLADAALELLEPQGPVIKGAGQAEAVAHQALLPRPVAIVHGPDLGQRHMALIHEQQKVLGEKVQQRHGGRPGGPVGDDAGIILDAGAIAQLRHHLHVVFRPLADPLGLHQLAVVCKGLHLLLHLLADLSQRLVHFFLGGDIVTGRIDRDVVQHPLHRSGDGLELADAVDLVAEKLHPDGLVLIVGGIDLHRIPPDPEHVPLKGDIVALIAALHQAGQQLVPVPLGAHPQRHHHLGKVIRLSQAIDAGDGGHHDHVPPLQQGAGGGEPQTVDLIVGGGILGDIGIRVGDIGLRLIVIVIRNEIFHRVVGEKLLELGAQLGRQGLVMGQDQGGPLHRLDHLGHGEGLAGAGDAQQHLLLQPVLDALRQRGDGLGLVAGGLVFRNDFKSRHSVPLSLLHGVTAGTRSPPWRQDPRPPR